MTAGWLQILRQQVEAKGLRRVARELGLSTSTVSQAANGKYAASTKAIEARVMGIYGHDGVVACPCAGDLTALECAENYEYARLFGRRATGNPETLRLYLTCLKCPVRAI